MDPDPHSRLFANASGACAAQATGSHLWVPNTADEQAFVISDLVGNISWSQLWMGLDSATGRWEDGTNIGHSLWR